MILLTPELRAALIANADARRAAQAAGRVEPDLVPLVKLFNPLGAATWLATELDADGDTLFGLADLGFGCPELGSFGLSELAAVRLPFGLAIERDCPSRPVSACRSGPASRAAPGRSSGPKPFSAAPPRKAATPIRPLIPAADDRASPGANPRLRPSLSQKSGRSRFHSKKEQTP